MKKMNKTGLRRFSFSFVVGTAALAFSLNAFAQWKWIDGNGVTQYSDAPPPASVPQDKILKRPDSTPASTAHPSTPSTSPADEQKLKEEKELEQRVKDQERKEKEDALKKEKEQAKQVKEACQNARNNLATFQNGQRIRQINSKGEYEYLNDKGLEQKRKQTQDFINKNCR